jgi:choline dehydrogenase
VQLDRTTEYIVNTGPYDYIVVGAGSAGCVLVERLSLDPGNNVLVLEAGGGDSYPMIAIPKGIAFTLKNPKYAWYYQTEPFGPKGQREVWMRGKVLGGSSSVNGMVYNRGAQADYDDIEARGNRGWGWQEMLRVYREMEDHSLGGSSMRGEGGPLRVGVRSDTEPVDEALMASAGALGIRKTEDLNATDEERIGYAPATIRKGLRQSAAKAFLHPALKRPNVTLRTGVRATRLLFEGDTVVGVEAVADGGTPVQFRTRGEVLLSAGSIASPQLLELSGIGSPDVLAAAGVDVRFASERVGEGVREHRCIPLQVRLNKNVGYNRLLSSPLRQGMSGARWMATRRGPIGTPAYDMLAFFKSQDGLERPDSQVLLTPYTMGVGTGSIGVENRPGLSLLGFTSRPTSEGSVHITSDNPLAPPRIVPNYLSTEHDRKSTIGLFRRMREILQQQPVADLVAAELQPGAVVDDDQAILDSAFLYGGTGYHACGAVAMGSDESYPVDDRLRVRGVRNLRVVDVSVMPAMVSGNLNAPAMAMAWRAAEMIRDER